MKKVMHLKGHDKEVDNTYRVIAQSIGMLVSGFFLLFVFGAALPDLMQGKSFDKAPVLLLELAAIAGFFLTFKSERIGTWIMLVAGGATTIYFLLQQEWGSALLYGLPFLVAGGLFMMHLNKHRALIKKQLQAKS